MYDCLMNCQRRDLIVAFFLITLVSSVAKRTLSMMEIWDSIPRPVKLAQYRYDVSLELCCSSAKPRRWALPLVIRFGVIARVV